VRLTERDQAILRHVQRYRVTTPETLLKVFYDSTRQSIEAPKSTLKRLRAAGYLASDALYASGNETYHHLTAEGAKVLGVPPEVAGPYDAQRLFIQYGRLLFCCHGPRPRPKFLDTEFDAAFRGRRTPASEFGKRFYVDAYYLDIDADDVRRLGTILVEHSRDIVPRLEKTLTRMHELLPEFFEEGRFALALVTSTDARREDLRKQLSAWRAREGITVPVTVEAYPALLPFFEPDGRA
jgi:hypothetical protein